MQSFSPVKILLLRSLALLTLPVSSAESLCPCIATESHKDFMAGQEVSCADTSSGGSFQCYPPHYGSNECRSWDAEMRPSCNVSSPEPYCKEPWCYVNQTLCHKSKHMYSKSVMSDSLYFSYSTCGGDPDAWKRHTITKKLEGKVVRIAFPMSYPENFYRLTVDGKKIKGYDEDVANGTGNYFGIWPDYWKLIEEKGGFQTSVHFVSAGSRNKQSSSWTACVQDVQNQLVDICPGDFWNTKERYAMVPFTVPLYTTKFFVMVHVPKESTDAASIAFNVFLPLTGKLWVCIILVTISVALLRTVLHLAEHEHAQVCTAWGFLSNLANDAFGTFEQLIHPHAEGHDHKNSMAVRVLSFAWGIFLFFFVSIYTANLTAFMVKTQLTMPIRTIDDCAHIRCTLCIDQYRINEIKDAFGVKINYLEFKRHYDVIEGLTRKDCDAALVEETYYGMKPELHNPDLIFTGQPVLSFFVGWPASEEVRSTISYIVNDLEQGSAGSRTLLDVWEKYHPALKYDPFRDPFKVQEGEDDDERFGVASMTGVLMICGGLVGVSVLLFLMAMVKKFAKFVFPRALQNRQVEEKQNPDSEECVAPGVAGKTLFSEADQCKPDETTDDIIASHMRAQTADISQIKAVLMDLQTQQRALNTCNLYV